MTGDWMPYWQLSLNTSYTLYNTFTYSSFLLISKGFCVIRDLISSQEASYLALIMTAVYFGFSAYALNSSLSVVLVLSLIVVQYCVLKYAQQSIAVLKDQLARLALSNIDVLMLPTHQKLVMMTTFSCLAWIYFVTQATVFFLAVTFFPWYYDDFQAVYSTKTMDEATQLVCVGLVFFVFRARYHGQYFNIELSNVLSQRTPAFYSCSFSNQSAVVPSALGEDAPVVLVLPMQGVSVGLRLFK
jgi:hypothetical protein